VTPPRRNGEECDETRRLQGVVTQLDRQVLVATLVFSVVMLTRSLAKQALEAIATRERGALPR
jgi:hypothetical protein